MAHPPFDIPDPPVLPTPRDLKSDLQDAVIAWVNDNVRLTNGDIDRLKADRSAFEKALTVANVTLSPTN